MMVKKPQAAAVMAAVSAFINRAVVLATVLGVSFASAQVQVVDSPNRLLSPSQNSSSQNSSTSSQMMADATGAMSDQLPVATSQGELFYKVQALQEEMSELRGMVEEQGYELRRLKQQRLDDYLNLDRRLTELGGKPSASLSGSDDSMNSASGLDSDEGVSSSVSSGSGSPDEMQSYRDAIDLVLRQKDYDQAVVAFNQYLTDFPEGRYAANSQYWLGEICLLQADLEKARSWFSRLLSEYPDHAKAPDAMYKLGTVYDKLGDAEKARSLLNEVVANNANTNAARLASNYLSGM